MYEKRSICIGGETASLERIGKQSKGPAICGNRRQRQINLPLLAGITSGFLSSFSNKSSDSDRNGNVTFSLTGRNPGLRAREPSRCAARTLRAPRITTVTRKSAVTMPTNIPRIGVISSWSRVPNDKTGTERIIMVQVKKITTTQRILHSLISHTNLHMSNSINHVLRKLEARQTYQHV